MASSVVATAAAAFRFTYPTNPERHEEAARLLTDGRHAERDRRLAGRDRPNSAATSDAPRGLAAYGYGEEDVDAIVEGALRQQRLLAVSPRPATRGRPRVDHPRVDRTLNDRPSPVDHRERRRTDAHGVTGPIEPDPRTSSRQEED